MVLDIILDHYLFFAMLFMQRWGKFFLIAVKPRCFGWIKRINPSNYKLSAMSYRLNSEVKSRFAGLSPACPATSGIGLFVKMK
jgi:hypothetical protein